MTRRTLVLIVVVLELAIIGTLVTQRVVEWHRIGWTGFTYHPQRDNPEKLPDLPIFGSPGKIWMVTPGSPADRAGLTPEDRIEAVDGIPITEVDALEDLSASLRSGDAVTYTVARGEETRAVEVTLVSPLESGLQVGTLATNIFAGLVWLAISLLVYWSRPGSKVAGVFFWLCVSGAAAYLFWAGGELDHPGLRGILPFGAEPRLFIFIGLTMVASIAMSNLVLHLALVFPKPRPIAERRPEVFAWIHLLPFWPLVGLALAPAFLFATRSPPSLAIGETLVAVAAAVLAIRIARAIRRNGWWLGLIGSPWSSTALVVLGFTQVMTASRMFPPVVMGLVFGLLTLGSAVAVLVVISAWAVIAAIALYRSYRESGLELRQQVRWPLWGTVTSLLLSVVLSLGAVAGTLFETEIVGQTYWFQAGTSIASKLLYLLIPISFAFAILKYRLLDIDVIIRKTVVYAAVTGFVVAVYLGLAGVSGLAIVQSAGIESQAVTIVATLAVVGLFVPVRNAVQRFVDRRFFQRERDLEQAAAEVADLVLHAADPARTLPRIVESIQRALRTSGIGVFTRRPGSDRLVLETQLGLPEGAVSGLTVSRDDPGLGTATTLETVGLEGDLEALARATRAHLMSVARRDGQPVALVTVAKPQGRADYDPDERRFLDAVADQVAVAVGRSMQRQAEGEFEKARAIQRSLLPQVLPEVAGLAVAARWEPARDVSGDYYDVIRLDEHRLLVCVGDVVGKGLPAALLMSTLQAAVKAVAASNHSPARLCDQVRSVVLGSLSGGTFITFFCALVDREAMSLLATNAGHNPPILVRASGQVLRLEHGGPAMARLLKQAYVEESVQLEPGDRLVLFTDGATEAMNPEGELFGDDRLQALAVELGPQTVPEVERGLASTVVAHARGVLQDDLTLVVVGVT